MKNVKDMLLKTLSDKIVFYIFLFRRLIMPPRNEQPQYIYAFDPKIKRRVAHAIEGKYAISLVTSNKFIYKK